MTEEEDFLDLGPNGSKTGSATTSRGATTFYGPNGQVERRGITQGRAGSQALPKLELESS